MISEHFQFQIGGSFHKWKLGLNSKYVSVITTVNYSGEYRIRIHA